MSGSNSDEKSGFQTEISQDVIDAAVQSVDRHLHPEAEDGEVALEVEAAPSALEEESGGLEAGLAEMRRELEETRQQLDFSQTKSREMMERLKESHERALRAAADLENYKKRAQKEKEEVQKFGAERLLKDFLSVMDNLDRALEASQKSSDFESLRTGVDMTRKLFETALGKHGVKGFSAVGRPFDPRLHEAMQQVESAEVPAGHVLYEAVRGYTLNERLVRPALVVVAREPVAVSEARTETTPGDAPTGEATATQQTGTTPTGSQ